MATANVTVNVNENDSKFDNVDIYIEDESGWAGGNISITITAEGNGYISGLDGVTLNKEQMLNLVAVMADALK